MFGREKESKSSLPLKATRSCVVLHHNGRHTEVVPLGSTRILKPFKSPKALQVKHSHLVTKATFQSDKSWSLLARWHFAVGLARPMIVADHHPRPLEFGWWWAPKLQNQRATCHSVDATSSCAFAMMKFGEILSTRNYYVSEYEWLFPIALLTKNIGLGCRRTWKSSRPRLEVMQIGSFSMFSSRINSGLLGVTFAFMRHSKLSVVIWTQRFASCIHQCPGRFLGIIGWDLRVFSRPTRVLYVDIFQFSFLKFKNIP